MVGCFSAVSLLCRLEGSPTPRLVRLAKITNTRTVEIVAARASMPLAMFGSRPSHSTFFAPSGSFPILNLSL